MISSLPSAFTLIARRRPPRAMPAPRRSRASRRSTIAAAVLMRRAMLDFNRAIVSETPLNLAINELIEQAEPPEENVRQYLGASSIGSECLRKIQYDWLCDPAAPDADARHLCARALLRGGEPAASYPRRLSLRAAERASLSRRRRAVSRPRRRHSARRPRAARRRLSVPLGTQMPRRARAGATLERDGLEKAYPHYAAQVWIYQAYLDVTEHPALFTAINADTCERLHLLRAVRRRARAGLVRPRRHGDRGDARRRTAAAVTDDPQDWRCKMCGHRERCWR